MSLAASPIAARTVSSDAVTPGNPWMIGGTDRSQNLPRLPDASGSAPLDERRAENAGGWRNERARAGAGWKSSGAD